MTDTTLTHQWHSSVDVRDALIAANTIDDERQRIAYTVAVIVAAYVGAPFPTTETSAEEAEEFVRTHAEDAMSMPSCDAFGYIVSAPLNERYLLDDFIRMRNGDQADAFA